MRGQPHTEQFWRQEIERLQLLLTQYVSATDRDSYNQQLASAKQHLAEIRNAPKA